MTQMIRKSLKLTEEEWKNLQDLAEKHEVFATRGTHTGDPSWRTLMKQIANGEIKIYKK